MASRYGLEIRGLSEADAGGVSELLASCDLPVDAHRLAERIGRLRERPGVALGAFEWGPPTGVGVAHWAQGLMSDAPVAHLDLVLVNPSERRRGVGRLLLKALAQAARQAGCGSLHVTAGDDPAGLLAFCLASGFERDGGGLVRALRKRV